MRRAARTLLPALLLASACGGTDRTKADIVTPDAATDGSRPLTVEAGTEAAAPSPCPVWSVDKHYGTASTFDEPLAAWALGDDDLHVLMRTSAVVHYDGTTWRSDPLPSGAYVAISGTSASDLWILGQADTDLAPVVLRNDGPNGAWTSASVGYPIVFDLTVLGPGDALVAASPTVFKGQGAVLRLSGGRWLPMPSPDLGAPYTIVKLLRLDATHVYGIGTSFPAAWNDVNDVLAAFDGETWSAIRMPDGVAFRANEGGALGVLGGGLQAVTATSSSRLYALASGSSGDEQLYDVSPDLTVWTRVVAGQVGSWPRLTVTGGGTLVGVWQDASTYPAPVRMLTVRDAAVGRLCTVSPSVAPSLVFSAPASPYVHLFGQTQDVGTPYHLIARIDP